MSSKPVFTAVVLITFLSSNPECVKCEELEKSIPAENVTSIQENGKNEATTPEEEGIYDRYISGKLQLGVHSVYRTLTRSDSGAKGGTYGSGTFLGTIYGLQEKQDCAPAKPFVTYNFSEHLGIVLSYDKIEATTLATYGTVDSLKTDGVASLEGPAIALSVRWPNETIFSPYASVGAGFFKGNFQEDATWAGDINTRYRQMDVNSAIGLILTAGATCSITERWLVDLSLQYTSTKADATFYGYTYGTLDTIQSGSFPMDNIAIHLGIVYAF